MLKLVTTTALTLSLAIATPSLAQTPPSPTKALVHIIVAEQFCRINAPEELVLHVGRGAKLETGLDAAQLADASYIAAGEIGRSYQTDGSLPNFCIRMAQIFTGRF